MKKNSDNKRGRPTLPSSQIRYDRVTMFMEREELQHDIDLARKMGISQQSLSRTLKSKKISDYFIDRIIEVYPDYRAQWFVGYDEFPTWQEYEKFKRQEAAQYFQSVIDKSEAVYMFMSALLQVRGYTLRRVPNSVGVDIDCHFYELTDRDQNVICYRDDKIAERIMRHVELELSSFLADAIDSANTK